MITRMDSHIGKMMRLLQETGIDQNTIVFFCSDNGAAHRYEGRFDSSGPLRGRKRDMYEGGLRVPMVVRWPGKVAAGAVNDSAWTFADFLPTAVDLAQGDTLLEAADLSQLDGVSVLPTLLGKAQKHGFSDRKLYWEFFERGFQQAVRWKKWKAIRAGIDGPVRLFDLRNDLGETTDVAQLHHQVVAEITNFLTIERTDSKDWPLP